MLTSAYIRFVPGWDCHGLPIELKALEKTERGSGLQYLPLEIRPLARQCALESIEKQKADFRRWGVVGEWDKPYITMNPEYEIAQLRLFSKLVEKGMYSYERIGI